MVEQVQADIDAGAPVGAGGRLNLVHHAAWLFHARRETFEPGWTQGDYEAHKEAVNARSFAMSESSRDIAAEGWVHEPMNPECKAACRRSFRAFCEQYFPQTFHMAWSRDHLKVIGKIETAVLEGGPFAMAMRRGSGKTTRPRRSCCRPSRTASPPSAPPPCHRAHARGRGREPSLAAPAQRHPRGA